ncbi:hypothetical protein CWATWH0402_1901 [Crocosphaera watsonii WH 0402]|uniref:Uncharacterized protein n=1 Tax=Crocosphaera watsonii WH 0402 TaxID=1284629 RepID=T2K0Y5_CROWT|nr:hypothetical protein CWATWH0402_1901 [Crocosphaera watsonii WH 0402]
MKRAMSLARTSSYSEKFLHDLSRQGIPPEPPFLSFNIS